MLVSKNDAQGIKTGVELTMTNGSVLYGDMFLCAGRRRHRHQQDHHRENHPMR